jgi:hypothetical protein
MKRIVVAVIMIVSLGGCGETSDPQQVGGGALGQANRVAIEANLREAATAAATYAGTSGTGNFVGMDGAKLMNNGFVPDPGITVSVASATAIGYCLEGTDGTLVLHLNSSEGGPVDGPC